MFRKTPEFLDKSENGFSGQRILSVYLGDNSMESCFAE